jgi:hypothetical protein
MENKIIVDKLSNKELKISLPDDMTCEVPEITIEELYNALTDQLVPVSTPPSRGCIIQVN